jgi:hypothetical protein
VFEEQAGPNMKFMDGHLNMTRDCFLRRIAKGDAPGQGLKILATSAKIPQILGALSAQVNGFARISDSDYDGVRTRFKRLKA